MLRHLLFALAACFKSSSRLVAENLCLRQQLIVSKCRQVSPLLRDADRPFRVLACHWFAQWRTSLIVVKPEAVRRWHRKGWKDYWRWRSTRLGRVGRKQITAEILELIRRMAHEIPLWGQRRIWAEWACLGLGVCARTVAKCMRHLYDGTTSLAGCSSWPLAATKSRPATAAPFRRSGFEYSTYFSLSTTALVS